MQFLSLAVLNFQGNTDRYIPCNLVLAVLRMFKSNLAVIKINIIL